MQRGRAIISIISVLFLFSSVFGEELGEIIKNYNNRIQEKISKIENLSVIQKIVVETEGMTFEETSLIYYKEGKWTRKKIESKGKEMPERLPTMQWLMGFPVSEKDYNIVYKGKETIENLECFKIELKPKRTEGALINGYLWISADYDIVKIENKPLKRPRGVKEIEVIYLYSNHDGSMLLSKRVLNSVVNAIIKDVKSITTFSYSDYKINSEK